MTRRPKSASTVASFCSAMNEIAPVALAQTWDNVGLLAGDPANALKQVLLCIDLTPDVVAEAIAKKVDMVMAYHPPIFKPITSIRANSTDPDAAVFRCIANGIGVYSTHTALDAANGGTNDVMAGLCGIESTEPLEFVDRPGSKSFKLVTFVAEKDVEAVSNAMFDAGAGKIGDYTRCSYRLSGQGTFLGGESTNPTLGERGRMEFIDEIRLETVVAASVLPAVVAALSTSHPYDEPAYDIVPLQSQPVRGIGRLGCLPDRIPLKKLAQHLERKTDATHVQTIGDSEGKITRAVIVVGAGGSLPFQVGVGPGDVIITGEMRHHDALTVRRLGASAIMLGHWASERPALAVLADRLSAVLPGVKIGVSEMDRDPFGSS